MTNAVPNDQSPNGVKSSIPSHDSAQQNALEQVVRVRYQQQALSAKRLNSPAEFVRNAPVSDQVISEQPLQISLRYFDQQLMLYQNKILTVTMRTPGDDAALVHGFLWSEGIIRRVDDVLAIDWHTAHEQTEPTDEDQNHVEVTLAEQVTVNWPQLQRAYVSYSSCGICGKASLKSLALKVQGQLDETPQWLPSQQISNLPELLWRQQALFHQTGGVHGAGYFSQHSLLNAEDVGRHNAVDKVLGKVWQQQAQHAKSVLILSGRISFELVQKAVMANIPVIVAVGAPSSLAIQAAQQFNITLIGFVKPQQFNVYHGDWRLC